MKTFLLDVDHTLVDFNQEAGSEAVEKFLFEIIPNYRFIGRLFNKTFNKIYDYKQRGKKSGNILKLVRDINSYKVKTKYKKIDFVWSREIWLKMLSDKYQLGLTNNQITKAIDEYWNTISSKSEIYPDAKKFLLSNRRIFIVAGSDRRLLLKGQKIIYNPAFSERKRIERTLKMIENTVPRKNIIVGDPYDKPTKAFWKKTVNVTGIKNKKDAVVIDDAKSVILGALEFGLDGILIDRKSGRNRGLKTIKLFDELKDLT